MSRSTTNLDQRRAFASALRRFASGNVTNVEYERACEEIDGDAYSEDTAVARIFWQMWLTYDDIRCHKLRGKWKLDRSSRLHVARCLLFLRTDDPYRWPVFEAPRWLQRLLRLPVQDGKRAHAFDVVAGDRAVWPFWSVVEFERARRTHRLLAAR